MGRLTSGEIQKISSRLNKKVDIPVLGEQKEQIVLEKIIAQIDNCLYELLPDEIYDTIHMISDGITAEEAGIIKTRVSSIINSQINIPILSEEHEKKLIDEFLNLISLALQKGKSLIESI